MHAMLTPVLTTAPADDVITLAEAKLHCRVDDDDEDSKIVGYIQAALARLDGVDGILGRALISQTWTEQGNRFPYGTVLRMALAPVSDVVHVKYYDGDNVLQTLSAALYSRHLAASGAYIKLDDGQTWPATFTRDDAIEIQYTAGYGTLAETVPDPIKQAMFFLIEHYYANRGAVVVGTISSNLPQGVADLLRPFRRPIF